VSTQLFKEYALADMSRYKEGKIGLRWRTEREVIAGKVRQRSGALLYLERSSLRKQ
jgi:protein FRA10AC1